jgi:hypothetical protein
MRGDVLSVEECYGHTETSPPRTDEERLLNEVLAIILEYADALEAAIAAVPEDEKPRPYTFGDNAHIAHIRPALEGEPGWPLVAIIASYVNEHCDAHTANLRAAFARGRYGHSG